MLRSGVLAPSVALCALALGLTVTAALAQTDGAPIVTPPIETHTTVTENLVAPPPDPQEIADASVTSSQAVLNTVIAPGPIGWANDLLGLPDIWRTTPPGLTYGNPAISGLAGSIQNAAVALIVLAVFARGLAIALGREDISEAPRLLFAAMMSLGNLAWWQMGIDLNNAINNAIAAPALPSLISPHLVTSIDPATAAGTVILLVIYAIVALLLLFSLIFRLGLIDILIAAGSLGLVCFATEQTSYIASHYVRVSVAVLFGQVLIVICLRCASVLGTLGSSGVLGTLLSIAILWLARSAPQAILSGSAAAGGSNIGGLVFAAIRRRFAH